MNWHRREVSETPRDKCSKPQSRVLQVSESVEENEEGRFSDELNWNMSILDECGPRCVWNRHTTARRQERDMQVGSLRAKNR